MKLLYFLDFMHFRRTGKSVTGLDYFAWDKGPVPVDLFMELSNNMKPDMEAALHKLSGEGFQKIKSKKKFDNQYFSKNEMRLLKDIAYIFKDINSDEIVESSHLKNHPWDRTLKEKGEKKKIDYLLAIDNDDDSLPYEEAKERLEERQEMYNLFGVS